MKQIKQINEEEVVFIDVETVQAEEHLRAGTPLYESWEYKVERYAAEEGFGIVERYNQEAGLFPEYAKIVCITVGRISNGTIKLKSYSGVHESQILEEFTNDLNHVTKRRPNTRLCGFAIKGFDIPFIFKRCLVNQICANDLLDVAGKKPWEVSAIDLKELWKGCGTTGASLVAVCVALGIKSPKGDISGRQVSEVFYKEGEDGLRRIVKYCEGDVVATINVFRVCRFESQIHDIEVLFVEPSEPENLMERIARTATISEKDSKEILSKAASMTYQEKEILVTNLKSALVIKGGILKQSFELEILSAT